MQVALEALVGRLQLALEEEHGAEIQRVVVRCRIELLGRQEIVVRAVIVLLDHLERGAIEPGLPQGRELQRPAGVLVVAGEEQAELWSITRWRWAMNP